MAKALTVYSNVINMRTTPSELVIDFGNFFPEGPNPAPPKELEPEVRVVMPLKALFALADAMRLAAEATSQTAPGTQVASQQTAAPADPKVAGSKQ